MVEDVGVCHTKLSHEHLKTCTNRTTPESIRSDYVVGGAFVLANAAVANRK